jgi:hypothetical protein
VPDAKTAKAHPQQLKLSELLLKPFDVWCLRQRQHGGPDEIAAPVIAQHRHSSDGGACDHDQTRGKRAVRKRPQHTRERGKSRDRRKKQKYGLAFS